MADEHYVDAERKVYKIRLYFRDFYGNPETITLKVRDYWLWAAFVLGLGLAIAALAELWLTRWRPRVQLATKLLRLKGQIKATTDDVNAELGAGETSQPNSKWLLGCEICQPT